MGVINQGLSKQHYSGSILVSYLNVSCSCTVIQLAADSNIYIVNTQAYELIDEDASKHTRCTCEGVACFWVLSMHIWVLIIHQTSKHMA